MIKSLPVEYSVVSATALQQQLSVVYDFPSGSKVSFLNRGLHDTYLITNGSIHLILKIYRAGWKSLQQIKAELDILLELKQRGVDVAVPFKDRNGYYVQEMQFQEGIRYGVVFMYAPGVHLKELSETSAHLFGRKLAGLHVASNEMTHEGLQRNYYLGNVFNGTMESMSTVLNERSVLESLRDLYFSLDAVFNDFDTDELKVGVCHGDAHFENAHFKIESGRVTFFDFDFCGNGYLLYDVGSFCHYEKSNPKNVHAFLGGYNEVLPLSELERKMIPFFSVMMKVFHLGQRARNADGSKNPLWPKSEIITRVQEITREVGELAPR